MTDKWDEEFNNMKQTELLSSWDIWLIEASSVSAHKATAACAQIEVTVIEKHNQQF